MARIHHTSRRDASRRGGRSYAGGAIAGPGKSAPELVPAGEGLVECPSCHGHVRLVIPQFTDREAGITGKTLVLGTHAVGGGRSTGWKTRCAASQSLPTVTS